MFMCKLQKGKKYAQPSSFAYKNYLLLLLYRYGTLSDITAKLDTTFSFLCYFDVDLLPMPLDNCFFFFIVDKGSKSFKSECVYLLLKIIFLIQHLKILS